MTTEQGCPWVRVEKEKDKESTNDRDGSEHNDKEIPPPKCPAKLLCSLVLLFPHSVTLYSASSRFFMHSIFSLTQSFCLLLFSSSPTLSKWSAAKFIICSGNGLFWLMTWPLRPILPCKNQRVGACLRMHVCHCVCVLVFLPLWEQAGASVFWEYFS